MDAPFPKGLHLFVIGDVHGCIHLLKPLAERIALHVYRWRPRQVATIFLGDYIDRGPASREVVELLIRGFPTPVIALRGNHEALLLKFIEKPAVLSTWSQFGGLETLGSYGVVVGHYGKDPYCVREAFVARLPADHLAFLRATSVCAEIGPYFFCHAGIRPGVPLADQQEADLLNIRKAFLQYNGRFEKIIVHGHTISTRPEVLLNRINIDTGAYATGILTCLLLREDGMTFM